MKNNVNVIYQFSKHCVYCSNFIEHYIVIISFFPVDSRPMKMVRAKEFIMQLLKYQINQCRYN